jgi:hypothetical protein
MKLLSMALATGLLGLTGVAQATLHDRGGGLIYDDVLDVTWLQDANYAKTSGYDADGKMYWHQASAWADGLVYYDSIRDVVYDDWRLPTVTPIDASTFDFAYSVAGDTDIGYNIGAPGSAYAGSTANELAYMFYQNLGNIGHYTLTGEVSGCYTSTQGTCLANVGPFVNLLSVNYWSGTEYPADMDLAWGIDMDFGYIYVYDKFYAQYGWAVRDGDVAAVPEPETYALMLAGLGLVSWAARRRP